MNECELQGERIPCAGGLQNHHLISKGKLQKAKAAKKYCEQTHPEIFIRQICAAHNTSRIADTKWARKKMTKNAVADFGVGYVRPIIDEIPWKVPRPELSYKAIMAVPLPKIE
ncbi:hypothetical protein LCGC14_1189410 [marine sediment metagenome]|uniref:Uncharacterized protein n=1 Tax=marine sediment metagenome TaxID=412755 RepID=A0A0F9LPS3_9ZZZZ